MNIKLDHMHIEAHCIRTMSKHQLRAELGKFRASNSCDMSNFESISTYFFSEICLLFPSFH